MSAVEDLNQVAPDSIAGGDVTGIPSPWGLLGGLAAPLLRGSSVARASIGLGSEVVRIVIGRSEVEAARGDWRFKDPTWSSNPIYKRVAQTYLAACAAVDGVVDDMEAEGHRGRTERARFAMGILTSALAPTNTLIGNPAALKKTLRGPAAPTSWPVPRTSPTTCAATAGCRRWRSRVP